MDKGCLVLAEAPVASDGRGYERLANALRAQFAGRFAGPCEDEDMEELSLSYEKVANEKYL